MARFDQHQRFDTQLRFDEGGGVASFIKLKPNKTMNKFKLELQKKTVQEKLALGATHTTSMTGNTNYPVASRVPTDAQLATAQAELDTANAEVDAAEVVWKQKIQVRDAKEEVWDAVITSRAGFCEALTPNDLAALASTGFPLRGAPTPIGDLVAPTNLVAAASDHEGEVELSCKTVAGASSYEWQCKVHQDAGTWTAIKTSTTRRITVTGLTPGTMYAFRVRAIGSAGPGPWSDEATRRAP